MPIDRRWDISRLVVQTLSSSSQQTSIRPLETRARVCMTISVTSGILLACQCQASCLFLTTPADNAESATSGAVISFIFYGFRQTASTNSCLVFCWLFCFVLGGFRNQSLPPTFEFPVSLQRHINWNRPN